jgi:multidrug resistance efflux pump
MRADEINGRGEQGMPIINVPKPLRDKLGEEASDSLVDLLNQVTEDEKGGIIALVEEKFERRLAEELAKLRRELAELRAEGREDRARLEAQIASVRSDLQAHIASESASIRSEFKEYLAALRAELKEDIANLRAEFKTDMAALRSEMIRWMFLFWVGQLGAMIGILFAFFRR